jgi:hypothetical protein
LLMPVCVCRNAACLHVHLTKERLYELRAR